MSAQALYRGRATLSSEHAHHELRDDVAKGLRRADLVEAFIALEKLEIGRRGVPHRVFG